METSIRAFDSMMDAVKGNGGEARPSSRPGTRPASRTSSPVRSMPAFPGLEGLADSDQVAIVGNEHMVAQVSQLTPQAALILSTCGLTPPFLWPRLLEHLLSTAKRTGTAVSRRSNMWWCTQRLTVACLSGTRPASRTSRGCEPTWRDSSRHRRYRGLSHRAIEGSASDSKPRQGTANDFALRPH